MLRSLFRFVRLPAAGAARLRCSGRSSGLLWQLHTVLMTAFVSVECPATWRVRSAAKVIEIIKRQCVSTRAVHCLVYVFKHCF